MRAIREHISALRFQVLLLAAAAIWGLATVMLKGAVDTMAPAWLVGTRFTAAGLIFCVLFAPRIVKVYREKALGSHLRWGIGLGVVVGAAYLLNAVGINYTTAAKSSFLTGSYCIMVPFLAWALTKVRPTAFNLGAAALCLAGIALVSLPEGGGFALGFGDSMSLVGAVLLALQVVVTAKAAPERDMLVLTAFQFLVGGMACLGLGALSEPLPALTLFADGEFVFEIAFLILGGTCGAILFQNVGLAHVDPSPGALLLSFESVFGVLFSVVLLGENVTASMTVGFGLIFAAVVVSEWLPQSAAAQHIRRLGASGTIRVLRYRGSLLFSQLFSASSMSPRSRAFLNVRPPAGMMDADSVLELPDAFPNLPVVVQYADARNLGLDKAA